MSEVETTDLVCKARREVLSEYDQRHLEDLLRTSLEARVMALMLVELERESLVQREDDELISRVAARAIARARRRRKRRPAVTAWLLAAAVLLVGTAAGAWLATHPLRARRSAAPVASHTSVSAQVLPVRSLRARSARASHSPAPSGVEASSSDAPPVESSATEPGAASPAANGSAGPDGSSRVRDRGHDVAQAKRQNAEGVASLFAQANRLRREGRGPEAFGLYQRVLNEYPRSREAPLARLALAKLLAASRPAEALLHYQAVANGGGALRAEALWGIAECAGGSERPALGRHALSDLVREFPDSPYAEAARGRLQDGGS